ncbi:MAG: class II glutamine amidotransferase [Phycisphaerales bacterium]|nr:class II glutamine amidotransferase [Phycisphaerae bacterium]NNF43859.1 class II glutamine amidotransferase [Phycisphaerales bacterium]NNM26323.1 class II glutamine amidotransferase [Phycisphaerales bacterium]
MCRLYGLRASEPTKVECTLVHAQNALLLQSQSDETGRAHSDGWGIACYDDGMPVVERRSTAAYADVHFSRTAERIYARTVVAHVRLATVGTPLEANTHPFSCGRWVFAHNGTVTGFDAVASRLETATPPELWKQRRGETDSEAVFWWLMGRCGPTGPGDASLDRLRDLLSEAVRTLAGWCEEATDTPPRLNLLLTDGHRMLVTRWNQTLHCVTRDGVRDCEICGIPHVQHDPAVEYHAVVVASEPISHESWQVVPDRSVLTIDEKTRVRIDGLA